MMEQILAKAKKWQLTLDRPRAKWVDTLILLLAVLCLLGSAAYVGYKSGIVEIHNADELVDGYMFQNVHTFRSAHFDAPHTFLIKWPLFAALGALHNTQSANIIFIIFTTIVTLLGLVYILSRITHNKLATALFALLLASITLLTPPIAHDHKFLPVNFSMVTTRNIEYLVYVCSIYILTKARKLDKNFWWSTIILILLGASDKFFVLISLLASLIWITIAYFRQKQSAAKLTNPALFFASAFIAYCGSFALLVAINLLHITHIDNVMSSSPFALVSSSSMLWTAVLQCIDSTLLNFGSMLFGHTVGISLLPSLINALVAVMAILALRGVVVSSLHTKGGKENPWVVTAYFLALATSAAYLLFILSNHDYTIDSRYVAIVLFAGFIAFAVRWQQRSPKRSVLILATLAAFVVLPLSFLVARTQINSEVAWSETNLDPVYAQVVSSLQANNTRVLVGNYWDVLPIRNYDYTHFRQDITAVPQADCSHLFGTQTSGAWTASSTNPLTSSAIILSEDSGGAQPVYDGCTLQQLATTYGPPLESIPLPVSTTSTQGGILLLYSHDVRAKLAQP